jgi:hypothetical protein
LELLLATGSQNDAIRDMIYKIRITQSQVPAAAE